MRRTASILWSAAEKFLADDGWAIASYIGLTLLMSLFPFLIFVGGAGRASSARRNWRRRRRGSSSPSGRTSSPGRSPRRWRTSCTAPRGGLLTLGAVLSFYFASSAIEALRVGLNRAYGLIEQRPWWLLRLQSLGLVLVGSLALLALAFLVVLGPLILDALAAFMPVARRGAQPAELRPPRRRGLHAGDVAVPGASHPARPSAEVRRPRCPGVALTFVASIVFGEAFGAYLSEYVRNYISMYAGLASAMIALVYLYWVALLFVFGGELNAAIMRARSPSTEA